MQLSICGSYADASDHAVFSAAVNKNENEIFYPIYNSVSQKLRNGIVPQK